MQWILTHGDTDGICSGAIAFANFQGHSRVFFTHPVGLAGDLAQVDGDVVICDIALPSESFKLVLKELRRLKVEGHNVIYIDHHPFPDGFEKEFLEVCEYVHILGSSASELTFMRFKDNLPYDLNRVAIYGAIGDTLDKTDNIQRFLACWEKGHLYLEGGLLTQAVDGIGRDYDIKRDLVKFLAENRIPTSDERLVSRAVSESINDEFNRSRVKDVVKVFGSIAYVKDMKWSLGKSALYAMVATDKDVGVGAGTRKGTIEMSLRTRSEVIDLNKILVKVTSGLGGGGGGHPKAAGARVPEDKFQLFLEMLDASVREAAGNLSADY